MTKKKNIKTEPTTVWLYRSFSEREIEVLRLSVKGFSNEEIAKNLHRSIHAIKQRKGGIAQKMNITGSCEMRQFLAEITPLFKDFEDNS